jgi:ketosteroid isomerase-like protein
MTEADDVVVAEGKVVARRTDGTIVKLAMCDVFEMRGGKIARLISYLMPTP